MTQAQTELSIDVVSDVVCPWCFVGKRQLEQALETLAEQAPGTRITVQWHPFQLNPGLPDEGMSRGDYLEAKFGTRDGGDIYSRVRQAASDVALDLSMDKISRQPNTVRAHALISVAEAGKQDGIVEALFSAYFQQGRDLTDDATLIDTAREAGLPEPAIEAALNDQSLAETIRSADTSAREMGINGVPFFVFNRKLAVSGAAGAETLCSAALKALSQAANDED